MSAKTPKYSFFYSYMEFPRLIIYSQNLKNFAVKLCYDLLVYIYKQKIAGLESKTN